MTNSAWDVLSELNGWYRSRDQTMPRKPEIVIEHEGEAHTIREWSILLGVQAETLRNRHSKGWPANEIIEGRDSLIAIPSQEFMDEMKAKIHEERAERERTRPSNPVFRPGAIRVCSTSSIRDLTERFQ